MLLCGAADDSTATDCNRCNVGFTTCCEGSRFSSQCVPASAANSGTA